MGERTRKDDKIFQTLLLFLFADDSHVHARASLQLRDRCEYEDQRRSEGKGRTSANEHDCAG